MLILLDIAIPTLGIIGIVSDNRIMLIIALVLIIIDDIIGFTSGELRSVLTQVEAAAVGLIVALIGKYNVFNTVVFALCMESLIVLVLGIISYINILSRRD